MGKRHKVTYIEPYTLGHRRPFTRRTDGHIHIITLPTLRPSPFKLLNLILKTRLALVYYIIIYPIVYLKLRNVVKGAKIFCSNIYFIPMVRWFGEPCYWDYNDNPEQFAPLPKWAAASLHRYLKQANGVFASSKAFEKKLRGMTKSPVYYIPNGLHIADFQGQPSRERVGVCYLGAISDWCFDFDLVGYLANRLPDGSLHLYGPIARTVKDKLDELIQHRSIVYQGVLKYENVPATLISYRVGIVPWWNSPQVRSVASGKVLQYLAAGLMVVSRPMDEYQDISPCIRMEADTGAFAESTLEYLAHPIEDKALPEKLTHLDWKNMAGQMEEIIALPNESLLENR